MELHNLRKFNNSRRKTKRVGRGLGSSHGTYSTRGMKGQRARSGGSKGLKLKGIKQMLLRIPKVKGEKSIHAKALAVNVKDLERAFVSGDLINPKSLLAKGLINLRISKPQKVKILGTGILSKQLKIENCLVSASARAIIEKAGGTISEAAQAK
jgi:large subunit ribosomal protein L15